MFLLVPWSVRNSLEIGRGRLTTSMGANACIGFGEGATGGYRVMKLDTTSEVDRNDDGFRCARAGLRRDPLSPLTLAPAKLSRFFAYDDWDVDDFFAGPIPPAGALALRALCNVAYWLFCALAVLGIGEHRWRITPLFVTTFFTAIMAVASFGVGRFHAPLLPLIAALAASTWYRPAS
jgi:4-amino-4-deoxy-L-arabinose transferase-like glycosyltransferase